MRRIMIAGIGTDVGKTVVSAIVTVLFQGDYWKPIQCGPLDASDACTVDKWLEGKHVIHPSAVSLETPASPHQAARLEGKRIKIGTIKPPHTHNTLIIEGVGGIMVPLTTRTLTLDLFRLWNCEWIIVSRNYLGSINHTLLTIDILKYHRIPLLGVIFNGETNTDTENVILENSKLPCLGKLRQEPVLDLSIFQKYAQEWKTNFSKII